MRLDLMSRFNHRVRHSLQHRCVTARMNRRHCHPLKEWEFLHCQSFIKILALNIETNVIVGDRSTVVFGGTEIHARRVVVLIVNDVHLVVPIIFNIVLLLLEIPTLKHHDLFITLLHHLVLDLDNLRLFQWGVKPASTKVLFEEEVLLPFIEVLTPELLVLRGLPLPPVANLDEMVSCAFELIGRELTGLLEHVFLWRRTPFFTELLCQVVGDVFTPVPPAHYQNNMILSCTELRY